MARQILDSRGEPTLEVELESGQTKERFSVPGGRSTGAMEVKVAHGADGSMAPALAAIAKIKSQLIGQRLGQPAEFDGWLRRLDPSDDKHQLGGNTMLALSGAYLRLSAKLNHQPVWQYLADLTGSTPAFPRIYANVVNGGKHAPGPDIQEFMVVAPPVAPKHAVAAVTGLYHQLGRRLASQFGPTSRLVGDEGGYAPPGASHDQIWRLLQEETAQTSLRLAADAAASSFYHDGTYHFEGQNLSRQDLAEHYQSWAKQYRLVSLEDPFAETDLEGFDSLKGSIGECFVVGDDLTTTRSKTIEERAGLIGGVIIKPNQIGTITETVAAIAAAKNHHLKVIASHRSGETLDTTIVDLAVGVGAYGVKIGAPARGERIAKYNRLNEIEEEHS